MRWNPDEPRCTCPSTADALSAAIEGVDLDGCPVHDAAARADSEVAAARAEADRHRAVLAAFKAETAAAAPQPDPPDDVRTLLTRALSGAGEPDTGSPT